MKQPVDIGRAIFESHFGPRFGAANPERMTNPYWEWEIQRRLQGDDVYPFRVRSELGIDPAQKDFIPTWTFSRMGATETLLADGARIFIGGEYEDWYDPDFYIYNDVIVVAPSGAISIFGYPREIFPPTDFHTATLVGNHIVIIGSTGYSEDRKVAATPVYSLSLADYSVKPLVSDGQAPGWIHDHEAELLPGGAIAVRQGNVYEEASDKRDFWKNRSTFHYDISRGAWKRNQSQHLRQFKLRREDSRHWSDDLDFGFKDFLTVLELKESQSDAEDLYRRRELARDGQKIEMHFDFESLEILIHGPANSASDQWLLKLKERLEKACGAACAFVERETTVG